MSEYVVYCTCIPSCRIFFSNDMCCLQSFIFLCKNVDAHQSFISGHPRDAAAMNIAVSCRITTILSLQLITAIDRNNGDAVSSHIPHKAAAMNIAVSCCITTILILQLITTIDAAVMVLHCPPVCYTIRKR